MTSLRVKLNCDPVEISYVVHSLVDSLAYRLNARSGFLDRLDEAIEQGDMIEERSAEAVRLGADVDTLRTLAGRIEERLQSLVGQAPRLRLVAAE